MSDEVMAILDSDASPHEILTALMPALARALGCERCIMFLRDPKTDKGRAVHRWASRPDYALRREDRGWQANPPDLVAKDPMYAQALVDPTALYIDDIETAGPDVLDVTFEREEFRHRALVHAPVYHEGEMYGVLEPSSIVEPRKWTDADRRLIAEVQDKIDPIVAAFVKEDTQRPRS